MSDFGRVIEDLYDTVLQRLTADPETSYTAALLARGPVHVAKKVGEEGVEAALAGALKDSEALTAESADLLYHLCVLWAALGVAPDDVAAALEKRKGTSGHDEKAARE